ncbi:protein-glutamate O-methyltransferase CheR [Longimicrobium sp.]|uniref:CheR family methyltransferase n=1 Tax=Longimicrobium sp. TaxID=2029185 RepID=UPI002E2F4EBD|nr:protein-glutamate O-methyltransferase CheR [Longimicrobium sp.]HEX6038780.1 protein-glutamate O-methyltransferase CheR [Longimicrobium sp.]
MAVALSDEEFRMWAEWLGEELGHRWGPERREILRTRLEPRRAALGLESFDALLFHLRFHPEREAERARLVPHLTNNESYFFRERGSLDVIRDEVLPELEERLGPGGQARLLSAACAAGEEAYTLSILAREAGRFTAPGALRVTGVDVDPAALERARAGTYTEHAFRGTDAAWRARFFDARDDGGWEVKPAVRAPVRFSDANLVQDGWWRAVGPQHLVLCRNVMIYFDEDAVLRAARGLWEALAPGGYLFLGHAESLRHVPVPFELHRRPGALFYRRPLEAA